MTAKQMDRGFRDSKNLKLGKIRIFQKETKGHGI